MTILSDREAFHSFEDVLRVSMDRFLDQLSQAQCSHYVQPCRVLVSAWVCMRCKEHVPIQRNHSSGIPVFWNA